MVFGVYRVNHPPSSVDHCCSCYFITPNEPNLVVAGGSLLRIFRYVPIQEDGQIRHRLEQVLVDPHFNDLLKSGPLRFR